MLNEHERWILFYDLTLTTSPDDGPRIALSDNLQALAAHVRSGDAVWLFNKETAALRVKQMAIYEEESLAVLLVHFADTKAGDPVFSHLETGELRTEPKLQGEGVALSAHLMLSTRPYSTLRDAYLALLEDVPGVGKTKLRPFINSLFKEGTDFHFRDENNSRKRCRSRVNLGGHQSRRLREDLERGTLRGVQLTSYSQVDGLDENGRLETVAHTVTMKVGPQVTQDEAIPLLNRLKHRAHAKGFADMRVQYTREEGRQKSITFGTAREDAGDALSVRSELVKVTDPLPQCSREINAEIVRDMAALILRERDGDERSPEQIELDGELIAPVAVDEEDQDARGERESA